MPIKFASKVVKVNECEMLSQDVCNLLFTRNVIDFQFLCQYFVSYEVHVQFNKFGFLVIDMIFCQLSCTYVITPDCGH